MKIRCIINRVGVNNHLRTALWNNEVLPEMVFASMLIFFL